MNELREAVEDAIQNHCHCDPTAHRWDPAANRCTGCGPTIDAVLAVLAAGGVPSTDAPQAKP